jgi:tRNA-splicing ligase RtcB
VGSTRKDFRLGSRDLKRVLEEGVGWALAEGYGSEEDRAHIEAEGRIPGADPSRVSGRALERGRGQLGTVGSGNHFVEVGVVEELFDRPAAAAMGLEEGMATVLIHTGSRGLGHQVCSDFISVMIKASRAHGIELPDRQLCCAPVESEEGRSYLAAMAGAANFAFVNRQMIMHWTRGAFSGVFGAADARLELVYDVCHNIAKLETHRVDGRSVRLCVHRKGATRAFPPGHREVPERYRNVGQPVLVPGDMGRCSYVLAGTQAGYEQTFGTACHGAGRVMSRKQAKKAAGGRSIAGELEAKGVLVKGASRATLVEEIPDAYKDVNNVVEVLHRAGIARKVAKLSPLVVIKG